jgi:UDP-N-acetylglucosamine 4,6-dehydratase
LLSGKNILITGGTGSFGRMFVKTVLENYQPNKLIIFSRDELKQYEMQQDLGVERHPCLRFFLGDVRDASRLDMAFREVDFVVHAAALKQVPALEYNPFEAVMTNVLGAQNVINAAIRRGVTKVVALSTDKAVNPVNLYGATKLCAEKLFVAANHFFGKGTAFALVRYGNVMASRGSVIPVFIRCRDEGKPIPVTDPRMTRFWITLEQGVDFVLGVLERMRGGELFVPKLPSMNIMDLARAMCPECAIENVGIRPGEKLHEVMIPEDEARNTVEFEDHFVIKPSAKRQDNRFDYTDATPVPEGFEYNSKDNPWQLSIDELQRLLGTL